MQRRRRGRILDDTGPLRGELGEREALFRLARYLIPLWRYLLVGLVFTLLWSAVNLGYGFLAKQFLDTIQFQVSTEKPNLRALDLWTIAGILVFVFRGGLYFSYNFAWSYAGQKLSERLRNEVFSHLQRLPVSFFDQRKTGQILSTISNDIPAINTVLSAIQDSISAPILFVGGVCWLFVLNWKLALISCICLPPTAMIIVRATAKARQCAVNAQDSLAEITAHAEETIAGVRVVKAFGAEQHEVRRFAAHSRDIFRALLRIIRIRLIMVPLVEVLGAVALILVLWIGGREIILRESNLTIGSLSMFVLILRQVADGAKNLGGISVNLTTAGVAADRVFTLLAVKPDIQDPPEAIELRDVQGEIEFQEVGFAYSTGIPVLAGISFRMRPGEVVALVGPTGSGKTTIAALIPRFYDVSQGRITVDGTDIRDCAVASLREQIGIVPQDTLLFSGTIRENISYGRLSATPQEIVEAAKLANAWEFISRMPQGLDTVIGERGTRLSGGQRQRIAIARAVLRDPRILILDEATSSLDVHSEALIQDALQRLVRDRTTLVIAHRLSTIRKADRILVIRDGQISESGTHLELVQQGGLYAELHRTQFRDQEGPVPGRDLPVTDEERQDTALEPVGVERQPLL